MSGQQPPALVERLVENLVDDGIRHSVPDDGWATVAADTRADDTVRPVSACRR
jgi:hypothetical protein